MEVNGFKLSELRRIDGKTGYTTTCIKSGEVSSVLRSLSSIKKNKHKCCKTIVGSTINNYMIIDLYTYKCNSCESVFKVNRKIRPKCIKRLSHSCCSEYTPNIRLRKYNVGDIVNNWEIIDNNDDIKVDKNNKRVVKLRCVMCNKEDSITGACRINEKIHRCCEKKRYHTVDGITKVSNRWLVKPNKPDGIKVGDIINDYKVISINRKRGVGSKLKCMKCGDVGNFLKAYGINRGHIKNLSHSCCSKKKHNGTVVNNYKLKCLGSGRSKELEYIGECVKCGLTHKNIMPMCHFKHLSHSCCDDIYPYKVVSSSFIENNYKCECVECGNVIKTTYISGVPSECKKCNSMSTYRKALSISNLCSEDLKGTEFADVKAVQEMIEIENVNKYGLEKAVDIIKKRNEYYERKSN